MFDRWAPCSVPGCRHPDGRSWRYAESGFCDFHGKLLHDFMRWLDSDPFLADLFVSQSVAAIRGTSHGRNQRDRGIT